MARYADGTNVSVSRSREELYRVLTRYGAVETLLHELPGAVRVGFVFEGMRIAFPFRLPTPDEHVTQAAFDRELRRRWRVLILVLKGRFESVAEGAESAAHAFLPYLMLPSGAIVADEAIPQLREAHRTGRMPTSLIPGLPISAKVIELPSKSG